VPRAEALAEKCRLCRHPNPLISDVTVGEPVQPWAPAEDSGVAEVEAKSTPERWAYWEEQFSKCIRLLFLPECLPPVLLRGLHP